MHHIKWGLIFCWFVAACGPTGVIGIDPPDGGQRAADAPPLVTGPCQSTCDGCCLNEICFTGQDVRACGRGGASCMACDTGSTCTDSSCQAPQDPCNGVSTEGRCTSSTQLQICVQPTGSGSSRLSTVDCAPGEACSVESGAASCKLVATCREGDTECASSTTLRTCENGDWATSTCPGRCADSALGAVCQSTSGTVQLSGRVMYELRTPNSNRTDWGTPIDVPAQGFLVRSLRNVGGSVTYYDTQVTSYTAEDGGRFTIEVPASPTANDFIIVYAIGQQTSGALSFVVADPRLSAGAHMVEDQIPSPAAWSWSWRTDSLSDGDMLRITQPQGAGAARVFDYLRYVYNSSDERWAGQSKDPLVVWLGLNVTWSCGACQWGIPTTQFGTRFTSQIFMPGGADQSYWSDSVTAHELGHWVMGTFGRSIGEGGTHCIGSASGPGLAWSEGWATWFSADARSSSLYLDKQNGALFWLDLAGRDTSGSSWPRPTANKSLNQDIYEFEVSAMMWELSANQGVDQSAFDSALSSPRMTVAPFARGYTRHTWDVNGCTRVHISDTGESTPHFADYLDALRCGGVSRAAIDAATEPASRYPYPSGSPKCR